MGNDEDSWSGFHWGSLALTPARRASALLALCLSSAEDMVPPANLSVGGLPTGRPPKQLVRVAAQELLDLSADRMPRRYRNAATFFGHRFRWMGSQFVDGDDGDTTPMECASLAEAVRTASDIGDATLQVYALVLLSRAQSRANVDDALATARRADAIPRKAPGHHGPHPIFGVADHPARLLSELELHQLMDVRTKHRVSVQLRDARRHEERLPYVEAWAKAAELLKESRPRLYADSLGSLLNAANNVGDIAGARSAQQQLEDFARTAPEVLDQACGWSAAAAMELGDAEAAVNLRRQALVAALRAGGVDPQGTADEKHREIERLEDDGDWPSLRNIGNKAYDLQGTMRNAGYCDVDQNSRAEARAMVELAELAWRSRGVVGLIAAGYSRAYLDHLDGLISPQEVSQQAVHFSRAWTSSVGKRRALDWGVRNGSPGDPTLLNRLEELLAQASGFDAEHLRTALAGWYLRAGVAEPHLRSAQGMLEQAAALGQVAMRRREIDGEHRVIGGTSYLIAAAMVTQSLVLLEPHAAGDAAAPASELVIDTYRRGLFVLAEHYAAARTSATVQALTSRHQDLLVGALRYAARHNDAALMDLALEVLRRDSVGRILQQLAEDDEIDERISMIARSLLDGLAADDDSSGPSDAPGEIRPGGTERSVRIASQVDDALEGIGSSISELAQILVDPRQVGNARAEDLLHEGRPSAVLQLAVLPLNDTQVLLVRYSTWQVVGERGDIMDVLQIPRDTFDEVVVGDDPPVRDRTWQYQYAAHVRSCRDLLLPEALIEVIEACTENDPLELTVIPSGLLHVPFEALPLPNGGLLIDRAIVTVVGSLSAGAGVLAAPVGRARSPVALYDTHTLDHSQREYDALRHQWPDTQTVRDLAGIRTALSDESGRGASGMFAFALHGARGGSGWSQVKQLPDGDRWTTAHALELVYPTLVVGASCNTDIRAESGDLSGMPLLFLLRGARTVIGTLHVVNDEAIADIMSIFWVTARNKPVAAALRDAKRRWLAQDPTHGRVRAIHLWSWLVAYGAGR